MYTSSPELVLLTILMWNILCRNLQKLLVWKSLDSREYLPIPKFNKSICHSQMFVSPSQKYYWIKGLSQHYIVFMCASHITFFFSGTKVEINLCLYIYMFYVWFIPHIIAFCWFMLQWLLIRASFTINRYPHFFISAIQCIHSLANDIYRLINIYSQSTLARKYSFDSALSTKELNHSISNVLLWFTVRAI